MISIKARKLFSLIKEGEMLDSIVSFEKRPWLLNTVALSEEEATKKGYGVENTVVQYRYSLYIDLWLFRLYFQWFSKVPTAQKLKY